MSFKKLAAIALAMTMSLSMLAACGDDDSSSKAPADGNSSVVEDSSAADDTSSEAPAESEAPDSSEAPESSEPETPELVLDEAPVPAEGDYQAFMMFASGNDWMFTSMGAASTGDGKGTDASITGDGTYTVSANIKQAEAGDVGFGYTVFCVDITNLAAKLGCATGEAAVEGTAGAEAKDTAAKVAAAKETGLSITNVSILQDGVKVYTFNDEDVIFADIEGNGKIRIEIYNEYGDSKTTAPDDVKELAGGVDEYSMIALEFTIDLPEDLLAAE